ncbi:hypothetical protein DSL60_02945 [Metamycoplasma hominis]|uniref:hypothetical protein n=1 Tax=Metamycoplasma hominis TaxID=2098 RepID=UPI000DED5C62|nr:hypothetical protein [Metamycoplasma hominis]RCJ00246.1 hypothetical protein DSL60_02945 [Metamycoplasma hominis]
MTSKEKKMKIKNVILNIIGFLTVALFLIIAILLFLAANGIIGTISKKSSIVCYVFGTIFLAIFILIVIKMILILKKENVYIKNAIDTDKLFANASLSPEENEIHKQFIEKFKQYQQSRNIYFGYLFTKALSSYKRDNIDISDHEINSLIEKMIIDCHNEFGIFDVYLAIDLANSLNKKLVWKGDFKKYKTYFSFIKSINKKVDNYILDNFIHS